MSVLSSILLIVSGLALIFMILNTRPSAREKKLDPGVTERMQLASEIARASAREGFKTDLDYDIDDLDTLERLIEQGWERPPEANNDIPNMEATTIAESSRSIDDGFFVLSAYLGELLVRNHKGVWVSDKEAHPLPYVYFAKNEISASPFDLVRRKMEAPSWFDLKAAYRELVAQIESQSRPISNQSTTIGIEHPRSEQTNGTAHPPTETQTDIQTQGESVA